jgi:predicted O-methyltransferase YrrM
MTSPSSGNVADILSVAEKQSIRNVDRMLPSQPVMRKLFQGGDAAFHGALESLLLSVFPTSQVEEKWSLELKPGVSYASLGSDVGTLHFYQFLIRMGRIRHVLELGTYVGVSTLYLAEAVGEGGMVTTVEQGEEFFAIAGRNFRHNRLDQRIRPLLGDAAGVLRDLAESGAVFDMVLIDAAKEEYAAMLAPALQCLAPGGLLLADDIFMNGDALNESPATDKGRGVRLLLEKVRLLPADHDRVILPIGNGALLVRKPR